MELIKFDVRKRACGRFVGEIDMEIGDSESTNDFVVDDSLKMGEYIAEIGGEVGGIVERKDYGTSRTHTGYTWRGLLKQWLILPPEGEDRCVVSGDLNDITRFVLGGVLGNFFTVPPEECGIEVFQYSFPLYCTVLEGLMGLYAAYGCKMRIRNTVEDKKLTVYVSAEKAQEKTLSESAFSANVTISDMGINHLLCAGEGKLQERLKVHLYMWPDGSIKQNPYYTGFQERMAFYEHTSQEDLAELIKAGEEKLREMASYKKMELQSVNVDADIGDYLTAEKDGLVAREPVVRKILTGSNGIYTTEIKAKGC